MAWPPKFKAGVLLPIRERSYAPVQYCFGREIRGSRLCWHCLRDSYSTDLKFFIWCAPQIWDYVKIGNEKTVLGYWWETYTVLGPWQQVPWSQSNKTQH